jgi:ubiquinone/menaquinone biosynthesis C-methylase UbiE
LLRFTGDRGFNWLRASTLEHAWGIAAALFRHRTPSWMDHAWKVSTKSGEDQSLEGKLVCIGGTETMTELSDKAAVAEEVRIRSAYAKRSSGSLYSWFNQGHLFCIQQLERRVLALLRAEGFYALNDKKILEIGCGQGHWLREFIKWGACPENITGIDLLPDRITKARQLCPQGVEIQCGNAARLAFHNNSFDLVLQFTAFSSILDLNMKKLLACEMLRVVKESGLIIWYDFYINNPRNPDVQGIGKQEIARLFPNCRIDLRKVTVAPPLSRLLAPYSWLGCYALERLRIFNTHYLGVIQKH